MAERPIKEIPLETRIEQAKASDPEASVWVSANAGSGKTHVLSERVIRLLLNDVEPSTIVCLTYTKAAASVMANRVFERLSRWTALDDGALAAAIELIERKFPDAAKLKKARRLFARALETPGGLKIQTIHAFCQMILGRFPLEANIAGHFELIDDELRGHFLTESRRLILQNAAGAGLTEPLAKIIGAVGERALETLLEQGLQGGGREKLAEFCAGLAGNQGSQARLFEFMGVNPGDTQTSIASRAWPLASAPAALLESICQTAESSSLKSQSDFGARLRAALNEPLALARHERLVEMIRTQAGERRSFTQLVKGALLDAFPDIGGLLEALADEIDAADDTLARLRTVQISICGFQVVDAALRQYSALKAQRSLLDHDDIIERTVKLLTQSGASAWVQYKLDQGINHVLVDEAQDTSPQQWRVIKALTQEFFSGQTSRNLNRTLFAVGDEKQSIYSFQGARPEIFAETGRQTARLAGGSGKKYQPARLNLSFRSTSDVLSAVDKVFELPDNRRGLTADGSYQHHEAIRVHGPGRVEIWPAILPSPQDDVPEDWTQGLKADAAPPARLAQAIAKTIAAWLAEKKLNSATGAVIEARDIMVLVRKRGPFVHALSRELKNRGIAVSGADRLVLTSHIAVKDLLAIARVCLMPGDDLSLAALLRSPMFAFADAELLKIAAYRRPGQSLYEKLQEAAGESGRSAAALAELGRWRAEAARCSVFEFYARILGRDQVRARLIQRLGIEAGDVIDEFLSHALAGERAGLSGLQDFVETLESAAPEIKREMDNARNEVRIMTVHAAKGQEAPIIFLVDPPPAAAKTPPLLSLSEDPPLFVWEPVKVFRTSKTKAQREALEQREEEEFRRLLYVGMTRAEDQLIVCGFGNSRSKPDSETWVNMVSSALAVDGLALKREYNPHLMGDISVWQTSSSKPAESARDGDKSGIFADLPTLFRAPLPPARLVPRPLSPSGASLTVEPETVSGQESPVLAADDSKPAFAIQRGLITHKLLEALPSMAESERRSAASLYLSRAAPDWEARQRDEVFASVFNVLDDKAFAPAFGPGSRAEVSVMGAARIAGQDRIIAGKIDRIAVFDGRVILIDFKTGQPPARGLPDIAPAYLAQMALYRALIGQLYPGRAVEAALLFTASATLHSLPGSMLDAALEALTDS